MRQPYRFSWKDFQAFRRDQLGAALQLTEQLGRIAHIKILGTNLYLISEPEVIRDLLTTHAHQLHRDPMTSRVLGDILGQGVFSAEDEAWQRQRKLVQPMFHASHIHDFVNLFATYARQLCESWKPGDNRRLDREMMQLTLRIICQTMFSVDVEGMTNRIGAFMQTIMQEAEVQLRRGLPTPRWLPTPGTRRQKQALRGIHDLLLEIIHQRRAHLARGDDPPPDLLSMLLLARDDMGQPLSDPEIRDECMTVFVAGHETTAVGLTWAWYLLLRHPGVLGRLTAEVDAVLGEASVTYDDLAKMPYLAQVVRESLRYYPPAPGFARTPTEAFSINGLSFKRRDILMVSIYALHRQAAFYPEPEAFRPERFAPEAPQPRYTYLPFGAGPRTCVGSAFAMLEMQAVLATMVQSLRLSLASGPPVVPELTVTLRPRDGVSVRVEAHQNTTD